MSFSLIADLALAASIGAAPNVENDPKNEIKQLGAVLVTGVRPGPGMWRVSNGSHVLWLLGTVDPLSKKLEWQSTEVSTVLGSASAVLAPPGAEADISAGDVVKMAMLARSANKATKLPGRQTLEEVLPADTYSQWTRMAENYAFDHSKSERSRPVFAAQEFYYGAIEHAGFTRSNVVWNVIRNSAIERGLPIIETKIRYPLGIDRRKYKAGIQSLSGSKMGDLACFDETLKGFEEHVEDFSRVSNAWAIGDIEELQRLKFSEVNPPCKSYYDSVMGFQEREHLAGEQDSAWISAAERALSSHAVTIAVLPLHDMLKPGGHLEVLRSKGYLVQNPDDAQETEGEES